MNDIEKATERYINLIKKFSTCSLLEFFSIRSIKSFRNKEKGITQEKINLYNKKTGEIKTIDFCYGQWELIQVCYDAIKYSDDYNGIDVNESSFYQLLNENKIYNEKTEKIEDMDSTKLFEHLQCLSNIQFDFQTLYIKTRFNRMYQILININQNKDYDQTQKISYINFKEEFKKITGKEIEMYFRIYQLITLLSSIRNTANIYELIDNIQFDTTKLGFTKKDIVDIIEMQSREYSFYKKNNNWNILRYYPIVKTNKKENKYIISNIYSLMLSLPDSIYWIIRNYYNDQKSNKFNIYFGKCFEYYFQEILDYYKIKYEKLEERKNKKTPDWKIETDKYIILIEQKAGLFPIDTRTSNKQNRFEKIENYFDGTIIKAFKQLNTFSIEDNNKTIIRICLTFEKIYMEENVKYILKPKMEFISDVALNWIVDIDEMEILMEILSQNKEKFNNIIEEKINLEKSNANKGRSFETILKGYKYNYTLKQINHFEKLLKDLKNIS